MVVMKEAVEKDLVVVGWEIFQHLENDLMLEVQLGFCPLLVLVRERRRVAGACQKFPLQGLELGLLLFLGEACRHP